MSKEELDRLNFLVDKRGDYSSNLTAEELEEYESLISKYGEIESENYRSLYPYFT